MMMPQHHHLSLARPRDGGVSGGADPRARQAVAAVARTLERVDGGDRAGDDALSLACLRNGNNSGGAKDVAQ